MPEMALIPQGSFGGRCNRNACQRPGADWYNHSTRAYYCRECAQLINQGNSVDAHRLFGHDLCTQGEKKKGGIQHG